MMSQWLGCFDGTGFFRAVGIVFERSASPVR
jgi:hypothetical protein